MAQEGDRFAKLLVSVRSAEEALIALESGAAFIDVKEPALGSLGRAPRPVLLAVAARVQGGGVPGREPVVSAALGELMRSEPPDAFSPVGGISLYKLGLSGCEETGDWRGRLG